MLRGTNICASAGESDEHQLCVRSVVCCFKGRQSDVAQAENVGSLGDGEGQTREMGKVWRQLYLVNFMCMHALHIYRNSYCKCLQ